ncbi:MAG: cytochrome b N-terminal domain-containing protein [Pseudonocardia sp.]|nr:cytochrome b N-terminal domain-containing protein [Pseudonocardia sp.]
MSSTTSSEDPRASGARGVRGYLVRVFPTHWTLLLGEIALNSLVVLVLTGAYLTLFFEPALVTVVYDGPYDNLRGVPMSHAYASALDISFEVRGGLFVRQLHSWAASVFIASLLAALVATFFTGAFRRPRRKLWTVGVALLLTGVGAAFTGVLLLDDLLSGTSLRMISGYLLAVPVVGSWLHWMLFGGEFGSTDVIPRLYALHLLLPAVMAALAAVAFAVVRRHGHPRFRRTERTVVGIPMPQATALFAATVGVLAVLAGAFQVNPVWLYGPANPAQVSAGSTAPWYFGWVDGAVRLWPAWEIHLGPYTIPPWFWPSIVFLPLSFAALALYPWIERRVTRDDAPHHLLQRPRDVPARTSLGVMVITFYGCLQLAAAIDALAFHLHTSADAMYWVLRIALLVAPPLAYLVTYRHCLGLQGADRDVLEHGIETGVIRRLPHGGYIAVRHPLGGLDEHDRPVPLEYRGVPVPKRMNQLGMPGPADPGSPLQPDPADETARIGAARTAGRGAHRAPSRDRAAR